MVAVIAIHDRRISRHGGAAGLRDRALLEMGRARALKLSTCSDAGSGRIAVAYAIGIFKAHAFVDGKKHTAFVTALTFLRLNGYAFCPDPVEGVRMMEDLDPRKIDETSFAAWVQSGLSPI
jgi:death-on-curing protein